MGRARIRRAVEAVREEHLRGPVRAWLSTRGFEVFDELPLLGRRADLVGVAESGTIAVELKLRDWRGALAQAKSYQLAVDRAAVAMPLRGALRAYRHRDRFVRERVGLLAVRSSGEVTVPIPAQRSDRTFVGRGEVRRWADRVRPTVPTGLLPGP